jgi:hypothetical protein
MEVLETLCQKMANSGHTLPYMSKVLKAGICSYSAKLRNSLRPPGSPNYKPLHQSTKYNSLGRWRNKVMARDTWYQGDQAPVPRTHVRQVDGRKEPRWLEERKHPK